MLLSSFTDTPTSEPPVLEISALNGTEDSPVVIYLSAHTIAGTSRRLTIRITSFPFGSILNRGTFDGQFWILTSADFGQIDIVLPEHSSGLFEITAEAVYADSFHGRIGTVQFTVEALADAPNLHVTHSPCIDSGSVVFMINSSLVDSDGSETLTVAVSGLPTGSKLLAGHVNEEDTYILDAADLQRSITATIPSTSFTNTISIGFIATATEIANNSSASTNASVSLSKCQEGIYNNIHVT